MLKRIYDALGPMPEGKHGRQRGIVVSSPRGLHTASPAMARSGRATVPDVVVGSALNGARSTRRRAKMDIALFGSTVRAAYGRKLAPAVLSARHSTAPPKVAKRGTGTVVTPTIAQTT